MPFDARKQAEIEAAWELHRWRGGTTDQRTPENKMRLAEAQNWRCCYCGVRMTLHCGGLDEATFEHVVPKSRGGTDGTENLVIACFGCNSRRGHAMWNVHYLSLRDG